MFSIQSIIQNAKQMSKSYERNAMASEGVIQQIAALGAQANESTRSLEARDSAAHRAAAEHLERAQRAQRQQQQHRSRANSTGSCDIGGGSSNRGGGESTKNSTTLDPKAMLYSLAEQSQVDAVEQQIAAAQSSHLHICSGSGSGSSGSSSSSRHLPGSSSSSSSNTCKPRSAILAAIQRESTQVAELKSQNQNLKQQLQEYQFALELIMSRYRGQMTALLHAAAPSATHIVDEHESEARRELQARIIFLTVRLQEMVYHYEQVVEACQGEAIQEQQERLKCLAVQNESLEEMYRASVRWGSVNYLGKEGDQIVPEHQSESSDQDTETFSYQKSPPPSPLEEDSKETTSSQGLPVEEEQEMMENLSNHEEEEKDDHDSDGSPNNESSLKL